MFTDFRNLVENFNRYYMNPILGIIPARYASSRFPGKPLIDILGKSMIQRVYEQAIKSALLTDVVVATDDERIFRHVESFGGKVVYTKENHPSGTDRCFEAFQKIEDDFENKNIFIYDGWVKTYFHDSNNAAALLEKIKSDFQNYNSLLPSNKEVHVLPLEAIDFNVSEEKVLWALTDLTQVEMMVLQNLK